MYARIRRIQQDYSKKLDEWESAFGELRTQRDNGRLSQQVECISCARRN
ncbi:MbeD/MobD family mobilization/exclusion protein [Enterobacteriaceae bacterium LUAb1]